MLQGKLARPTTALLLLRGSALGLWGFLDCSVCPHVLASL